MSDNEEKEFEKMNKLFENLTPESNHPGVLKIKDFKANDEEQKDTDDDHNECDGDCENCEYGIDIYEAKADIFEEIVDEMYELYLKKNKDYGDAFGQSFEDYGIMSTLVRLGDKYNRLKALAFKDADDVNFESIEDTLIDLANYSIMTLIELRMK